MALTLLDFWIAGSAVTSCVLCVASVLGSEAVQRWRRRRMERAAELRLIEIAYASGLEWAAQFGVTGDGEVMV